MPIAWPAKAEIQEQDDRVQIAFQNSLKLKKLHSNTSILQNLRFLKKIYKYRQRTLFDQSPNGSLRLLNKVVNNNVKLLATKSSGDQSQCSVPVGSLTG